MATDFYGSCTGGSAKKYDVWIKVKQNSQNIKNNKSNVTVSMYVKRNDGYDNSAYNINSSANTVKLSVGGNVKVNKNIAIDTRNGVTVKLASWTGDVTHSADGTLNLKVGGSFTISGTSSLSGGSVSGSFKCSTIPRKSTLSFSKTTLYPTETVVVTVTTLSSSFTHKIKFILGNKSSEIELDETMKSVSFTIPDDWAEEITTAKSGTVTVSVTTYKSGSSIGSNSYNLKLLIPDSEDYSPEFSVALTRIDNNVPAEWNVFLKGESQVEVAVENIQCKKGATFSSAEISVGNVSLKSTEAVFDLPLAGDIEIKTVVKDSRGMSKTAVSLVKVEDYSPPSVNIKSVRRCNSDGAINTYGTNLLVEYETKCSFVNGNNTCKVFGQYKSSAAESFSDAEIMAFSPCVIFENSISISETYTVSFYISDEINKTTPCVLRYVSNSKIPFNIKRGGDGAAFGKFAEEKDTLSVAWNIFSDGEIKSEKNVVAEGFLKGILFYEDVSYNLTEFSSEVYGTIRYYPCFESVYLDVRVRLAKEISAGTRAHILTVNDRVTDRLTPFATYSNSDDGAFCKGAMFSGEGQIAISCNKNIPSGKLIYLNGFYHLTNG